MSLHEIMKKNEIDPNWVFTHAKFHDKEGLFFFESVIKENDETKEEEHYFDTKCILIDDAKFVYGDDMEKEIIINSKDNKIVFNRIDGASVSIPKEDFDNLPFEINEFSSTKFHQGKPSDYMEID